MTREEALNSNNDTLEWLGENCKDCGNEKCKKLGTLPKGYSCALWHYSLHTTDKKVQKQAKQLGYKGCKNCQHQIEPLRMCRWAEQGGDGLIHLICPKWDKVESEDKE